MSFSVELAQPADVQGLAETMMDAMFTDPHWVLLWDDPSLPDITAACVQRLPWNLITGTNEKRHQKAVEVTTGQVVGYARWVLPSALAEKRVWQEAQVADPSREDRETFEKNYKDVTEDGRIRGLKHEMNTFRSRPLEEADARIMKEGPYLTLDYLTVAPSFQRRGVATLLVQSGLRIADAHGMKTYVMSSTAGLRVYLNHGFEIVETVSQDYPQYGGMEPSVHYFLVRQARSTVPGQKYLPMSMHVSQ